MALNLFLLQQNAEGRTVVLVIDEAQNLEAAVLEQIRLISNLETDREKLIQIVLSGQPEFAQILKRKEMRQLSQRITVRYHLQPMDFQDTVDYINHRLEVAGGRGGVIFSQGGAEANIQVFTGASETHQCGLRPGAPGRLHERHGEDKLPDCCGRDQRHEKEYRRPIPGNDVLF